MPGGESARVDWRMTFNELGLPKREHVYAVKHDTEVKRKTMHWEQETV